MFPGTNRDTHITLSTNRNKSMCNVCSMQHRANSCTSKRFPRQSKAFLMVSASLDASWFLMSITSFSWKSVTSPYSKFTTNHLRTQVHHVYARQELYVLQEASERTGDYLWAGIIYEWLFTDSLRYTGGSSLMWTMREKSSADKCSIPNLGGITTIRETDHRTLEENRVSDEENWRVDWQW